MTVGLRLRFFWDHPWDPYGILWNHDDPGHENDDGQLARSTAEKNCPFFYMTIYLGVWPLVQPIQPVKIKNAEAILGSTISLSLYKTTGYRYGKWSYLIYLSSSVTVVHPNKSIVRGTI